MKTRKLQILALALISVCSCVSCDVDRMEMENPSSADKSEQPVTIIANIPGGNQVDGRLVLDEGNDSEGNETVTVRWKSADERFYVLSDKISEVSEFRQVHVLDDNRSSRFSGILPAGARDFYYAYYAGNSSLSDTCSINSLPYDLSNQSGALGDSLFNNLYMYAKVFKDVDNMEYDFHHLGLIVKLSLTGFEGTPSTIMINGDAVSSSGTFDLSDNTYTTSNNHILIGNASEDADPDTEDYDMYVYMLPTDDSGKTMHVTLATSDAKTYEGKIITSKPLQAGFLYSGSVTMTPMDMTYILTDETETVDPETGDGSVDNPYEIHTASHFKWLMNKKLDQCYKLTHSIEISISTHGPILGELNGVFDGSGCYITGRLNTSLFSKVTSEGVVRNIHVATEPYSYEAINGIAHKNVIAGITKNNHGIIENCSNSEEIAIAGYGTEGYLYMGGIAAVNNGKIISCTNWGNVNSSYRAAVLGGIAGYNTGIVIDSHNYGTVRSSSWYAGGIVGESINDESSLYSTTVSGCTNKGKISGWVVGGIVGVFWNGSLFNCHNMGDIGNDEHGGRDATVGGIAGKFYMDSLMNCRNDGKIFGGVIGGIAGWLDGPKQGEKRSLLENCVNNGVVIGHDFSGGIVGRCNNDLLKDCVNNAQVNTLGSTGGGIIGTGGNAYFCINGGSISGNKVGGIVGEALGVYNNCENHGTITGVSHVGGIVGNTKSKASSIIDGCNNRGQIQVMPGHEKWQWVYMGGLLGNGTEVRNSRNYGNVTGKGDARLYMGGVAGVAIEMENCINEGFVTDETSSALALLGNHYVGGVAGYIKSMSYCENKGAVQGGFAFDHNYIGGIAGYSENGILESINRPMATIKGGNAGERLYLGGIVGFNFQSASRITKCCNQAQIIGGKSGLLGNNLQNYTGGVIGSGSTRNCINEGKVIGGESEGVIWVGGIAGLGSSEFCENKAEIIGGISKGSSCTGGIVGGSGIVESCKNHGDVKGGFSYNSSSSTGGILGDKGSEGASYCENYGMIFGGKADSEEAKSVTGGIAGYGSNLKECHNYNEIVGGEAYYCYTGGVSGNGGGENLTNDGKVTGGKGFFVYVGGIVGNTNSYVLESKNKGDVVVGEAYNNYLIGGIAGSTSSSVCATCCVNTGTVDGHPANENNLVGDPKGLINCGDHSHIK